jgi:hypothetical protein
LVYLVLGAAGSGRREIVADLVDGGLAEGDRAAVLLAEGELGDPADAKLGSIARWRWDAGAIDATLPPGASHIFLITDGRRNPIDQIEAFKTWLSTQTAELARILCVVNCRLAEQHPPLLVWYDACVHFSDIVFLHRRDGVANKWITAFQSRFKDQFFPCLIELVKSGRVGNPALILEPQALRMSHAFGDDPEWVIAGEEDEEIDEELETDEEEEVEMVLKEDPYFARRQGGRREKEIPDIGRFLKPILPKGDATA